MADDLSAADQNRVPRVAAILGGLGLLPFIIAPIAMASGDPAWAEDGLRYYAATILAFMGGIHWGLAIGRRGDRRDEDGMQLQLILSVIPSLFAWFVLLQPTELAMLYLICGFAVLFFGDQRASRRGWTPEWYIRLRGWLNTGVVISLAVAAWL